MHIGPALNGVIDAGWKQCSGLDFASRLLDMTRLVSISLDVQYARTK